MVGWSVGPFWLVGLTELQIFLKGRGKLHFHAPIGALVLYIYIDIVIIGRQ